jgi:multisubunit Na+/H+ antiporter MnhB subunit
MEQLLNLIGLLVALAIVGGWLWHRRCGRRHRHETRLLWQILAVGLVVLFLFFAISISDDLHWTAIATEAEGSRKIINSLAARVPVTAPGICLATLLIAAVLLFTARKRDFVDRVVSIGSPAAGFCQDFSSRSPPFLS